ncbi:MAG: hypothetical protein AB1458_08065 [Bacteroidota bacterium]
MKNLRTLFFLLMIPALAVSFKSHAAAYAYGPKVNKAVAHRVLKKTAYVIVIAHKKVKEGKNYTGDLAKAIAHQKYARKLYKAGKYLKAIHHSRRARFLAVKAIVANGGTETADMKFSKEDEAVFQANPAPGDDSLDAEMAKEMKGEQMEDAKVVNTDPDVDLPAND